MAADLVGVVAEGSTIVTSALSGEGVSKAGTIIVDVTNNGDTGLEKSDPVLVHVLARPVDAVDDSQDVLLNVKDVVIKGSKLGAGATSTAKIKVMLPASMDEDTYDLIAQVDPLDTIEESNENNNEAVEEIGLVVAPAFVDLEPTVSDKSKLPAAMVSGDGTKIQLVVDIANNGNVALDKSALIDVTVTAVPTGGGDDVELGTFTGLKIGGLAPGKPKSIKLQPSIPAGVATGDYTLRVDIDSSDDVDESDEGNNDASTAQTIAVTLGQVELDMAIDKASLPTALISGEGFSKAGVSVEITNTGNVPTEKTQTATVTLIARPDGGGDDVELGSGTAKIGNAQPGKSKKASVKGAIPANLPDGDYTLIAVVTLDQPISGVDTETEIEAGDLTVAEAFVDIAISDVTNPFGASAIEETAKSVSTTIVNNGNVEANGTVTVQYFATTTGSLDGSEVAVSEEIVKSGKLKPGQETTINGTVTLPSVFDDTDYTIIAKVTYVATSGPNDSDGDNNTSNVGLIDVQATPPSVTDILGMIIGTEQETFTDGRGNPGGIGLTGQVVETGQISTSTGLNTGFAYARTWTAGSLQKSFVSLQIEPGQFTQIDKVLNSTGQILLDFKNANDAPDSLVGKKLTFSTTKPSSYQATATIDLLVDLDEYHAENVYVTITDA